MVTLDLSNHDLSTFDPVCLRAAGVERVIAGCWDLEATKAIVAGCRANGIIAEDLYCFLYYGLPWETREVENAISIARSGGISRVWLDCEASPPNERSVITPEERIQATITAGLALEREGVEIGIYTGEYYWRSQMANTGSFAHVPLWLANYGTNDPKHPRPPITEVSFGGWSKVSVHQYSSTIEVCGRRRDHNYWMMEEDMELREKVARLERLLAGNGIAKDPSKPAERITGEEALQYADKQGWSAFLGLVTGPVAPHSHGSTDLQVYGDVSAALSQAAKAVTHAGNTRKGDQA